MTGICWAVVLEREESVDIWLAVVERLMRGFEGAESYFVGDARPVDDDDRGGRSGPFGPNSVLSREGALVLADRPCSVSSSSPALPRLS